MREDLEISEFSEEDFEDDVQLDEMFLIVEIATEKFALSLAKVREIVLLPEITEVPTDSRFFRGVIKIREDVIKLIDVRIRLGMESLAETDNKLINELGERKHEHIAWLNELKSAIEEKREFKLTTNPHACKFGQWYDNFQTDNMNLKDYLRHFDQPHKAIHKIADKAIATMETDGHQAASKIIEETVNNELKTMIDLFDNISEVLREARREIAVIVEQDEELIGISVDKVDKIINIEEAEIQQSTKAGNSKYFDGVVNVKEEVFIIFNEENLLQL